LECSAPPRPGRFFEVRLHLDEKPGLSAVCAGYELKEWRDKHLAGHLIKYLPEFALPYSERQKLGAHNAAELLAQAAKSVYMSEKYKKRGEIGELLLHVICAEVFKSFPAITKYFYKDSANNTVKGFDAVHVVTNPHGLELWLGESKFYKRIGQAIAAAISDLEAHTKRDYMRAEFTVIRNMVDPEWPHADKLKLLLHPNISLDNIFNAVCIPVLLTYNSDTVNAHQEVSETFKAAFEKEVRKTMHSSPPETRLI
jgi:hypothetical protein